MSGATSRHGVWSAFGLPRDTKDRDACASDTLSDSFAHYEVEALAALPFLFLMSHVFSGAWYCFPQRLLCCRKRSVCAGIFPIQV